MRWKLSSPSSGLPKPQVIQWRLSSPSTGGYRGHSLLTQNLVVCVVSLISTHAFNFAIQLASCLVFQARALPKGAPSLDKACFAKSLRGLGSLSATLHGKTQGFVLRLPPQHNPHATSMQPLQCVLQHHVANPHVSTHMATEYGNNHTAIALRSAARGSTTA